MVARLGVVIAIAWGCSSSAAPPPPPPSTPVTRSAPPTTPPPSVVAPAVLAEAPPVPAEAPPGSPATETWTGMGFQPDAEAASQQWSIELHLYREAAVGARLGTIEYPSLGCSGELIRAPDRKGALVATERLLVNPRDTCVDGGTIVLRDQGERLDYRWYERSGVEGATATLQRTAPR